jgi:CRP-like cAMP-binding protein
MRAPFAHLLRDRWSHKKRELKTWAGRLLKSVRSFRLTQVAVNGDLQDALARLALFADFEPSELGKLLEIAQEVSFQEGERVVERGQLDIGLYVIVDGEASVVYQDEEVAVLPRGSFFGEISSLLGEAVVADIVARSPLRCLVIPPGDVEQLLLANPRVALRMLKTEARRLKTANEARA